MADSRGAEGDFGRKFWGRASHSFGVLLFLSFQCEIIMYILGMKPKIGGKHEDAEGVGSLVLGFLPRILLCLAGVCQRLFGSMRPLVYCLKQFPALNCFYVFYFHARPFFFLNSIFVLPRRIYEPVVML